MRSNEGMANRQGDVELRFAQVSAPNSHFGLALLGLIVKVEICRRNTSDYLFIYLLYSLLYHILSSQHIARVMN